VALLPISPAAGPVAPASSGHALPSSGHNGDSRSHFEAVATNAILLLFFLPRFSVLLFRIVGAPTICWSAATRRLWAVPTNTPDDPRLL
jgi:hypothetical protein